MTKMEVLKRCPFVRELNDEQLEVMAKICHQEVYEVGEFLGKQGRVGEKIFIIEEGLVGMYMELGPMNERLLQSASNFEAVGWGAMLAPYRNTVTAKAIETTKVLAFNGRELMDMCEKNTSIGYKVYGGVASVIAVRLRSAYSQLMGVTVQDS
ncbi:Crp/Fnr family transcriptional regulator [Chloroflexota bacterium]